MKRYIESHRCKLLQQHRHRVSTIQSVVSATSLRKSIEQPASRKTITPAILDEFNYVKKTMTAVQEIKASKCGQTDTSTPKSMKVLVDRRSRRARVTPRQRQVDKYKVILPTTNRNTAKHKEVTNRQHDGSRLSLCL